MGNCFNTDSSPQALANRQIDTVIEKERKVAKDVKLLLLGAGESGKSTIFKQMKIIHKKGYDEQECARFKDIIFGNILQSIRVLINAMNKFEMDYGTQAGKNAAEEIGKLSEQQIILNAAQMFPELHPKIKAIWQDPATKKVLERRAELQLNDSADYYLNDLERIAKANYMPNQQDVLRSRVKTVGIVEMDFQLDGSKLKMVDVGGQRNERRKWIHCFDDVTAIIFVTSLSEYDQVLFEDETQNRMKESLQLFDEICNCRYFRNTSIVVFFNKEDLFKQKIEKVDLKVCFENYTGGCNYKNALEYIQNQFLESTKKVKNSKRQVTGRVTCATDTQNVTFVFNSVRSIILVNALTDIGM